VMNGTVGAAIFQLPVGYRPPETKLCATETNSNANGRCDVLTDGTVLCNTGNNAWFSIEIPEFDTNTVTQMAVGPTGPQGPAGPAFGGQAVDFTNAVAPGVIATFTGLNGNADLTYEVILDLMIVNVASNPAFFLRPNGISTNFAYMSNRSFSTDGATANNDTTWPSVYAATGFFAGNGDWNTGCRIQSTTRISARCINSPQTMGRGSIHQGYCIPNTAGTGPTTTMSWRGSSNWNDGSTNITSLQVVVTNGSAGMQVSGRATLRVVS
jgi:hypothetical protein